MGQLGHPIQQPVAYLHKPTGNVFSAKDHAILVPKWQRQFAADMTAEEIAADFTPLFASHPPTPAGVREITDGEVETMARIVFPDAWRPRPASAGQFFESNLQGEQQRAKAKMRAALAAAKGAGE
jgi:hypothetical protein